MDYNITLICHLGGSHVDEVFLMFSHLFLPRLRSSKDIDVSNMLLDLWTTFAKDGYTKYIELPYK